MSTHRTISPDIDMAKLTKTSLFLSGSHLKELRKLSRRTMIPLAALVRRAIGEFLEREKKKKP